AGRDLSLGVLTDYEAVALFLDRAALVLGSFALDHRNASLVVEICRRLDGIPLAIELAAAKVGVLSVGQIADRLDERFRLLTGGSRTAIPRHQTLQAAVDWSYDLLSESQQAILRRLSVFVGGFSLVGAEAICAGIEVDRHRVLDGVTELAGKSLLIVDREINETRYRLLETIRHYGRQRLLEAGEAEEVLVRHRDWFLGVAEKAEPKLRGPHQIDSLHELDIEHDNLRSALVWSFDAGDVESTLRIAAAMGFFWRMRG